MRANRPWKRPERETDASTDGLSRRGWLLLVTITVAVGVVLIAVGLFATGLPAGGPRADASSGPQAVTQHTPDTGLAPTPLGLPPRQTPTHVVTAPTSPLDSLKSGACLQTYVSKWANGYPVVDCSKPHIAQLLATGVLPQPAGASFPGTTALDTQVSDLCEPFLNWHWVAIWNEDVQLDLRYPNTNATWTSGARSYYCFVYTFSRHELTDSAMSNQ